MPSLQREDLPILIYVTLLQFRRYGRTVLVYSL